MPTLYERTMRGKRAVYTPVAETTCWDSFPAGSHLVVVKPGGRSVRFRIDPAYVDVLAALNTCRDDVMAAMREASAARPASRLLTPIERKAIAAYTAIVGPDAMYRLEIPAASSVIDALEAALIKAI